MGKASSSGDLNDVLKHHSRQNIHNYALQRAGTQGSSNDRGQGIAPATVDTNSNFKVDTRWALIKGATAFKGVASAELASDGIIDLATYATTRLYITNTGGYTLKVIKNILGDGGLLLIRSNAGVTTPIQNTSGTGSETTGNIETMSGSTYSMVGDDWIALTYDNTDSKWHQLTAGKNGAGGGGTGEVFTWTANHSANNFDLTNIDDLYFNTSIANGSSISGTDPLTSNKGLIHSVGVGEVHYFTINNAAKLLIGNSSISVATDLDLLSSSDIQNVASITMAGNINMGGNLIQSLSTLSFSSGNFITQSGTGDMEYRLGSSADHHKFYVSSERFRISNSTISSFLPITMSSNNINDIASLDFDSVSTGSSTTTNISSLVGNLYLNVPTGGDILMRVAGTTVASANTTKFDLRDIYLEMDELSSPPTGTSNTVRIYAEDNGAGKTRLMAIFATGAAQQIVIQP